MDELLKLLKEKEEEWQIYADTAASFLKKAPEGKVKTKPCHGKYHQYFYSDSDDALPAQYAGADKAELIQQLVQKDYCKKVLSQLNPGLRKLQSFTQWYSSNHMEDLYENLPEARKALVEPVRETDEDYIEKWLKQNEPYRNGIPLGQDILTNKGEPVRSKSEKIIADKLAELDIPYSYEAALSLSGLGTVYPDFTILNVPQRKTFHLEHFGLMGDPDYVQKSIRKILAYQKSGYWFGENFLFTLESENLPLNVTVLDEIIQKYLVE